MFMSFFTLEDVGGHVSCCVGGLSEICHKYVIDVQMLRYTGHLPQGKL